MVLALCDAVHDASDRICALFPGNKHWRIGCHYLRHLKGNFGFRSLGHPCLSCQVRSWLLPSVSPALWDRFLQLNARPQEKLDQWLTQIRDELAEYARANSNKIVAPYAVNQRAHMSNDRLMEDMQTCVEHQVPIIITSLRPPAEVVEAVHSYGGLVFHDVINVKHAKKAIEQGVDGVITVCSGAGVHAGTTSPFALVKEVRKYLTARLFFPAA
jgi:nitronate monooxygenase